MKQLDRDGTNDSKPLVVNGITYDNEEELRMRIEADAAAMAQLIYDIYRHRKTILHVEDSA